MPRPKRLATPEPNQSAVVTKAMLKAAARLGVTNRVLANIVGLSEASVSRMRSGILELQPDQKAFELALLFIRACRSLDAIAGGDDTVAAAWLRNPNTALNAEPITLIQSAAGLMNVIQYLDARRAVV